MKRTVKALLIFVILLSAIFVLTGCGKQNESAQQASKTNPIVGAWKSVQGDYIYHFNEDGTGDYTISGTKMEMTYKTEGSKISITYKGNTKAFETEYRIDGYNIKIKDSFGCDKKYKKQ